MKKIFFGKNLKYLRKKLNLNQDEIYAHIGFKRATWSGYETESSFPNFKDLLKISEYFRINEGDLINTDLENVHLNEKKEDEKNQKNVHLNVHPSVHLIPKKEDNQQELKITITNDPGENYGKMIPIPITDIAVAAGTSGMYNNEYIESLDSLRLPASLTKKNATYLAVKIKGHSMAPTLQDSSYIIIRLLDKSEWDNIKEERICVVSDKEGKTYLKRIKNRFKQGFITLMSDNPDKVSFPNFNLTREEIHTIWYAEWYLSAKMPNIHDQFYPRLQRLEEQMDQLLKRMP